MAFIILLLRVCDPVKNVRDLSAYTRSVYVLYILLQVYPTYRLMPVPNGITK